MELPIPRATTFECPEGVYRAVLHEVREHTTLTKNAVEKKVRLIFEVKVSRPDRKLVLAGKNYSPSLAEGSELRNVIECWQGEEFLLTAGTKLDLRTLVSCEADIMTRHCHSPNYAKPFVDVVGVAPPGTLTLTNQA